MSVKSTFDTVIIIEKMEKLVNLQMNFFLRELPMGTFGPETTSCVVYTSLRADVVEKGVLKVHKTVTANRCSPLQNALGCFKLRAVVVESGEMWCLREEIWKKIHLSRASFPGEEFGCSMVQIITPWMQRAD